MRTLYILALLLLLSDVGLSKSRVSERAKNLHISPTVVGYCYYQGSPSPGDVILLIKIQLKYTNAGRQPLILDKRMRLITYYQVSRTLKDLATKKYKHDVHVHWEVIGASLDGEGEKPSDRFVVLKPDESYEAESEVRLTDVKKSHAGSYVMRAAIPTWFDSEEQARELQMRWKDIGLLQSEGVVVSPISFRIESNPKIMKGSDECEAAAQQRHAPDRE